MCGRFTLKTPVANWLADLFPDWLDGVRSYEGLASEGTRARYNIAPSQPMVVVHCDRDGLMHMELMRWGLLPHWANSISVGYNMINARSETLAEKPSFRPSLFGKRCVVMADGYYEWKKLTPKTKQPFWIHRPDEQVFAMAGLWAENRQLAKPDGPASIRSATIITTPSNADTQSVHDRMPAIMVRPDQITRWLDPIRNSQDQTEELLEQLCPMPEGSLQLRSVSGEVNSPKNEGSSLIKCSVDGW
jgi:putative SOS response-associated peptidase YedK